MTELEFCEHWCGELTENQTVMVRAAINKGQFLGVGRAVGRSVYMPLVWIGKGADVLDAAGHYQTAQVEARIGFERGSE